MVNNFTGSSNEEIWQDNRQTKLFFERAKEIKNTSKSDIYTLIGNISLYCQMHSTRYKDHLHKLQLCLSECIQSICNNDNTGFTHLSEFLKSENNFIEKYLTV